jgi:hypothetical protein
MHRLWSTRSARTLTIALLLLFVSTPLARYSRGKGIPPWLTFTGLLVVG